MRYYKHTDNGYIISIGTGAGGEEITAEEYATILERIRAKTEPVDGCIRRVKTDLSYVWEPMPDDEIVEDDEVTGDELKQMLEGIV